MASLLPFRSASLCSLSTIFDADLAGGGGEKNVKGGRHLRLGTEADETPLANLHMPLLDKLGIPAERLGDSNGQVNLVSDL